MLYGSFHDGMTALKVEDGVGDGGAVVVGVGVAVGQGDLQVRNFVFHIRYFSSLGQFCLPDQRLGRF